MYNIAYAQIGLLITQCLLVSFLLLLFFRLRTIFGLVLFYIAIGLFKFMHYFYSQAFSIEIISGINVSIGSTVMYSGILFAILLIYIREGALEVRKIIYALVVFNIFLFLLLYLTKFSFAADGFINIFNLPASFFEMNLGGFIIGTLLLFLNSIFLIALYEYFSKSISSIFLRIFLTMGTVLIIGGLFFNFSYMIINGFSFDAAKPYIIGGLVSKTIAVPIYSLVFSFYLVYFEKRINFADNNPDTFSDVFNLLTYREKYEKTLEVLKNKESKLLETEEKFRVLTELSPIGMTLYDNDGNAIYINKKFAEIVGVPLEEALNINWGQLIHPDDRDRVILEWNSAIKNCNDISHEYRWVHQNGEIAWTKGQIVPVKNSKGKVLLYIGTLNDITIRKQAEEKLKESEGLLKSAQQIAHIGNYKLDVTKGEVFWSDELLRIYGLDPHETGNIISVKDSFKNVHPEDAQELKAKIDEAANQGRSISLEYRIVKPDGEYRHLLGVNKPILDERGNLSFLIGTAQDITDMKKAQDKINMLNRVYKMLSNTNQAIVRMRDKQEIYNEICRIAVEDGGFINAYIGMLDTDTNKVNIIASKGDSKHYLENLNIDLNDSNRSMGPIGKAIKTGVHSITNNIETDNNMAPWREEALTLGFKSIIALPLTVNGKTIGAFIIYASEINCFNKNEIKLLDELAMDISFATEFLEEEARRKLAEEELQKSKDELQLFFDDDISGDYLATVDGQLLECNKTYYKIFQFNSKEEALNYSTRKLFKFSHEWDSFVEIIKDKKRLEAYERKFVTVDGKTVTALENAVGVFNSSGKLIKIRGYIVDITQRTKALEEIKKFSRAMEQSPASVIITNLDGNIEYVNNSFCNTTGYSKKEVVGKNPKILKSGFHDKLLYENLWSTILSGKEWKADMQNKKKNGNIFWESVAISSITNKDGEITHFVSVQSDITEKMRTRVELIEAKEKAEISEKVKTEFLAQMSHEIRSPLNVILNFVDFIKDEIGQDVNEDVRYGFGSIDTASHRIIRTIDLILNMTDLQVGSYTVSKKQFNAVDTISQLVAEYKQSAFVKNIKLKQNIDFEHLDIISDEYALSQIIGNLIDNAIKYTKEGYVEISVKKISNDKLKISVTDTGIGISKEFLPKIFAVFTQEEQGYSRAYDGNGLGMALVKRYCDLINADISVVSKKGEGTTFNLILPN